MSMAFHLVIKDLIYLVQLPSVIVMGMSEQQSGEGQRNQHYKVAKNTLAACFHCFCHCKTPFRGEAKQEGIVRILKLIQNTNNSHLQKEGREHKKMFWEKRKEQLGF